MRIIKFDMASRGSACKTCQILKELKPQVKRELDFDDEWIVPITRQYLGKNICLITPCRRNEPKETK